MIHRDDLNHSLVSGNKLHKLAPVWNAIQAKDINSLVSFGGPFSNHLHALAWACKEREISVTGLIRGELQESLTPTLEDCQNWGMRLVPMSRKSYRECIDSLHTAKGTLGFGQDIQHWVKNIDSNALVVPEGGSNLAAIESLANAYRSLFSKAQFSEVTHAVCATGTGATVAGLALAAPPHVSVIGVQAVAEGNATINRIRHWLGDREVNLQILPGHLGGFAKSNQGLKQFITEFETTQQIPLDEVYNGKVMYKLAQMAHDGAFGSHAKILVLHTGGLQGKRSIKSVKP